MNPISSLPTLRPLLWGLLPWLIGGAHAADPTTTTTVTPPPAANYTDTPRVEHHNTGTFYAPPYSHSSTAQPLGGLYMPSYTVRRPDMIFFPPLPPALGDPLPKAVPAQRNQPLPPPELAGYVQEIFMPQLGTLLFHNDLPRKWRVAIEAYRVSRDAAVDALRAQVESVRGLDRAERTATLQRFADEQQPALAELESEAERIRDLLTTGTFWNTGTDWNDSRSWRLGDDTQWESNIDELRVLRASIFYARGLSIEQRELLRELVLDLATLVESPLSEINLSGPGPAFSFAPAPARLRLPPEMPEELRAQMDAYREDKDALKRELRDLLYAHDRIRSASRRATALRALAERQAPRLASLLEQEEQIRLALQDLPGLTPQLTTGALPAPLLERVNQYLQTKTDLQDALTRKLKELRAELPFDRIEYARVGTGYGIVHVPSRQTRRSQRAAEIDTELKSFNTAQVARFDELTRERAAIVAEVQRVAERFVSSSRQRSVDSLLRQFDENVVVQQRWSQYQDYHDATLLPGLSPAQRRLLFGAGVDRLALPLLNAQR